MKCFSVEEKEIVFDALNLFGFENIYYLPAINMYILRFQQEKYANEDGPRAVEYLSNKIPTKQWAYADFVNFNERIDNRTTTEFVMNYFGWSEVF